MKEQYQKEISQIHVPTELLEKTKQAMKEEEEKASSKPSEKIIPFRRVSVAAAAIILLVLIPAASGILKDTDSSDKADVQMHLSKQEEIELQTIKQEKNWLEELVDTIKEFFD